MRFGAVLAVVSTLLGVAAVAPHARALTQPNGNQIPNAPGCNGNQPTGLLATFACACTQPGVCNIGAACPGGSSSCDDGKHGTCESTIWHVPNDNSCIPSQESGLDPVAEAATTPETFHPTCALTFTLLSRGTAIFKDAFGWYNVTGAAPDPSDLHPMLDCNAGPGAKVVLDLSKEPAYKGGEIGFFLLTPESRATGKQCAAGSNCCPTVAGLQAGQGYVYYSEKKFNPDQQASGSFIHLLTYGSHLTKAKFYFAWEDIFGGSNGDFTDLVTSVDGVECPGGGSTCDTGKPGACALGVTTCQAGAVTCQPAVAGQAEQCNGVDDDCNGNADDGATCPNAGEKCINGRCVPACGGTEFPCSSGTACDDATKTCVPPSCVGVSCPSGQVCRVGKCVTPCSGVTCPHGQTCLGDECVDLCAGTSCPGGQVCREGVCFPSCASCDGVSCASGSACDVASGQCVDPSCPAPCPSGTYCKSGSCVDACDGAVCPEGEVCSAGQCHLPGGPGADGGLGGLGSGGPGDVDGGAGNGVTDPVNYGHAAVGCSCDAARSARSAWPGALALVGALAAWTRRRRR